jgi:hypothetical protein
MRGCRSFAALPLWVVLGGVAVVAGCGGDETGAATTTTATPTTVTTTSTTAGGPVDDVTLTAQVRLDGSRVLFDYVLANGGPEPIALVDPASVVDELEPSGEGAFRASFLRTSADPATGGPLPSLRGKVAAAGAEIAGTAGITGQFEQLPETVQLCIEIVPRPWTDAGGGVAEFPYRLPGTAPALACTERLPVDSS